MDESNLTVNDIIGDFNGVLEDDENYSIEAVGLLVDEAKSLTSQCYEYNKEVGELKTALKNAREFVTFSEFSSWRDNVLAEIEKVLGE